MELRRHSNDASVPAATSTARTADFAPVSREAARSAAAPEAGEAPKEEVEVGGAGEDGAPDGEGRGGSGGKGCGPGRRAQGGGGGQRVESSRKA